MPHLKVVLFACLAWTRSTSTRRMRTSFPVSSLRLFGPAWAIEDDQTTLALPHSTWTRILRNEEN